uniref:Uncharacterized protein n=1 Tax=Pithovirus LCPAC401 TaxID=2506595 RepID=A0A481ZAD5_9VIRU|nr:MAG: hypothetical protein LCPAC401_05020 [Pithovirus LCPAC401]
MAVYQVSNAFKFGFTDDYQQAKRFLTEIDHKDSGSLGGIRLLVLDEYDGQFKQESFVPSEDIEGNPLRKLTFDEVMNLPDELYILVIHDIDYIVFASDESRFARLRYQHYKRYKKYLDTFGAYLVYDETITKPYLSYKSVIANVKNERDYVLQKVRINQLIDTDMKTLGVEYLSRTTDRKMRVAYATGLQSDRQR